MTNEQFSPCGTSEDVSVIGESVLFSGPMELTKAEAIKLANWLLATVQQHHEPRADDPLVQCRCGWLGKTSELAPNTFGQGKVCPGCAASFWPATL